MTIATKGLWVDSKTNQLVDEQPEEGHQIVAVGTEISPVIERAIERAEADFGPLETTSEPAVGDERPLADHSVTELRVIAEAAGIDPKGLKKPELVEAIEASTATETTSEPAVAGEEG